MMLSFAAMRDVHELLVLLHEAAKAPISVDERIMLRGLLQELQPPEGWSTESLAAFRAGTLPRRVRSFLVSLRPHFDRTPPSLKAAGSASPTD
jgi:hypothetical protein